MNKILKISVATVLSSFLLIGCSGTPDAPDSGAVSSSYDTEHMSSMEIDALKLHNNITQEKLAIIVRGAGEEAGWRMTEFKRDTFIAEKIDGEETTSVSIKFNKEFIEITPENDDLQEAIKKALAK